MYSIITSLISLLSMFYKYSLSCTIMTSSFMFLLRIIYWSWKSELQREGGRLPLLVPLPDDCNTQPWARPEPWPRSSSMDHLTLLFPSYWQGAGLEVKQQGHGPEPIQDTDITDDGSYPVLQYWLLIIHFSNIQIFTWTEEFSGRQVCTP